MRIALWLLVVLRLIAPYRGAGAGLAGMTELAERPMLTVRVIDYDSTPRNLLRGAVGTASSIFRKAGLGTEWLICGGGEETEPCGRPGSKNELAIKILAPRMEARTVSTDTLGAANRPTLVGFVFLDHVDASPVASPSRRSVLLGAVIAHEAGHLLGLEHSDSGVMLARFLSRDIEQASVGRLVFRRDQARQLREAISSLVPACLVN